MCYSEYEKVAKHFSIVSGLGVSVVDKDGYILFRLSTEEAPACGSCRFCEEVNKKPETKERCRMTLDYGAHQSRRFRGRYIFFCHRGLAHFTSPVVIDGKLSCSITAGPFLMVEREDYIQSDLAAYYKAENQSPPTGELIAALNHIPVLPPEKVHALSEILLYSASYLSHGETSFAFVPHDQPLPAVITDYIEKIEVSSGFYPLEKEDELLAAMAKGDITAARSLLNELLGYIFFYSGARFDVIRSRVLELIVLLSRAAVKGGADAELIFGLNYEYLQEIGNFENVDDLSFWLSAIMNRFTDYVFHFVDVKHADVIYKAIDYIKSRYMTKLTLDDVAKNVFLSPAYFSRVFKEETEYSFSSYLNKVRIEESKKLLRNERINLADIAGMVGYEDQSYFTKVFKKMTGMTPLRYRQSRGSYTGI
jgi:AraC-like DNA-binding protein/ligand-binding sensor protein